MAGALRAPPEDLNPQDLGENHRVAYAARRTSPAKLSFAVRKWPETVVPCREKAIAFTRLSMLIGPSHPGDTREEMVEPPGIAPGSSPLISCAFISIVRSKPDRTYIGQKS